MINENLDKMVFNLEKERLENNVKIAIEELNAFEIGDLR
jgi:hypothetical protein